MRPRSPLRVALEAVLAEPVTIRVRHELEPYQRDLLARLGASYVVDPNAPRCVAACGRHECRPWLPRDTRPGERRKSTVGGK